MRARAPRHLFDTIGRVGRNRKGSRLIVGAAPLGDGCVDPIEAWSGTGGRSILSTGPIGDIHTMDAWSGTGGRSISVTGSIGDVLVSRNIEDGQSMA